MRASALSLLWAVPLAGAAISLRLRSLRAARAFATVIAAAVTALGAAVFVATLLPAGYGSLAVGADGLSAILLPLVGALALGSLVAMPRASLDARAVASTLVSAGATLGVLVSTHPLAFTAFWTLSVLPLRFAALRAGDPALLRAVRQVERVSVAPLCVALLVALYLGVRHGLPWSADLGALGASHALRPVANALGAALLVAALARLGNLPFHAWAPSALARAPLPVSLPAVVSPVGSIALVRVLIALLPDFFVTVRPLLLGLGAASMAYGALLALGQHDARRQMGYLWVSVVGMAVMGLGTLRVEAMSGALLHETAALLAVSGLLWVIAAIEARTGTIDMRRLGGLVRFAPSLATAYLLLGMAMVGIPGTMTFVSEDLLVQGLLRDHAAVATLFLLAAALNGVTLVRSFKRIFLGPASAHAPDFEHVQDILPRERWAAAALIVLLLAGGLAPAPLLSVRAGVLSTLSASRLEGR